MSFSQSSCSFPWFSNIIKCVTDWKDVLFCFISQAPSDMFSSFLSLHELTEPPCEQQTSPLDWSRTPLRLSHEMSLRDSASLDASAKGSIFHVNDGELSASISTKGLPRCPSGISSSSQPSLNFSPGMEGTHGRWRISVCAFGCLCVFRFRFSESLVCKVWHTFSQWHCLPRFFFQQSEHPTVYICSYSLFFPLKNCLGE